MCVGRGCRADKPLLDFEIWCFPINVLVEKYFSLSFKLIKWNFTTIGHPWKMLLPPVSTREKTSQIILLRSESPINKCAKLHTEAASNNRDHAPRSLYYCLIAPHIYQCCSSSTCTALSSWNAHSTKRQRRGCNNIPSFLQRTALIARSFLWRLNLARPPHLGHSTILLRSEKPERHVRKASHCGSKQQ